MDDVELADLGFSATLRSDRRKQGKAELFILHLSYNKATQCASQKTESKQKKNKQGNHKYENASIKYLI